MIGSPKVIAQLQIILANELAAIDQYFIHSRMYEDWGLTRLYQRIDHESMDEREHASRVIRRMLFLEATPDMSQRDPLAIGTDVPSMLANDLKVEYAVAAMLKHAITVCEQEGDFQTRAILEQNLKDTEEDHAWWLEQQLGLIDKIGLPNYLQAQMGPSPAA